MKLAGGSLRPRCEGLVSRRHAELQRQLAQGAGGQAVLVAPGHFLPAGEVCPMGQAACGRQRRRHNTLDTVSSTTLIDRQGPRPDRQYRLGGLQRAIAK